PCTSNPCLNDGFCSVSGNSFKCACREPFFGDKCEKSICSDDVCIHGKCEIIGQYYRCSCCERIEVLTRQQVMHEIRKDLINLPNRLKRVNYKMSVFMPSLIRGLPELNRAGFDIQNLHFFVYIGNPNHTTIYDYKVLTASKI
ncbi:hypothetical protein AVEN_177182-1, partial [Araneus ventricosus]